MKTTITFLLFAMLHIVNAQTPIIITPTPLQVCDTNNDGFGSFDLNSKNAEILGSLNPNEYTVSYHLNQLGSFINTNLLSSPYVNAIQNQQTVFVRVQENSNNNNFETTTLQLIVSNEILINNNTPYYEIYENPFDGVATFDLTTRNELITTNSNFEIAYYLSQADAENLNNPIANPAAFTGNHLQTIWFRVTGNNSNCFAIGSYVLKVFDSSLEVNIPDPIFKARLLSSSETNQIARNGDNVWFAIDANDDGEIQVSEALEVTFLNLSGFVLPDNEKINSLEGINSFANLIQLECQYNLLDELNLNQLTNLNYLACSFNNLTVLNLHNFPNLEVLYCGFNPLTNLSLQLLPNLKNLDCSSTFINSLDVTPFNNLINLSCNNAQLTSLNVNGLSNLDGLNCTDNQLATINLQGLNSLFAIRVNNNALTALDVQQAPNLQSIEVNNNQLTDINIGGLEFLHTLECNNNLFTSINIENVTNNFQVLRCSENSLLETLFVKNGLDEFIWAANCPNLEYVCADESQILSILSGFAGISIDCVVNSYCTFLPGGNYNTIKGKIIFDANSNGCDASDLPQPNIKIDINDGTNQGATFSSFIGNYGFYTSDGSFTVTPNIENSNWFTISPSTATIPFVDINNNEVIQDFCITPNGFHPDLEIVIAPIFPSRPGQDAVYQIVYKNKGNQTLSQVDGITLTYDQNKIEFISATTLPTAFNLGQIKWSYTNLIPFENRSFFVTFNINTSTETNPVFAGDVLQFTTSITPTLGDETPSNNSFEYNETVVDSFITNTITCLEGPIVSPDLIGDYLHYIINFENTGTAIADNIVLRMDINEDEFEINTLQILNTSHNCYTRISGNVAEFILENAMLDTGGHGNILLKIRTKDAILPNEIINNQARIFYDYRAPISTNDAETTFAVLNNPNFVQDATIKVYPNPTSSNITINSKNHIQSIELYDVQGRLLQTQLVKELTLTIDLSNQTSGIYFVKVKTDVGVKVEKVVKK